MAKMLFTLATVICSHGSAAKSEAAMRLKQRMSKCLVLLWIIGAPWNRNMDVILVL